MQRHRLRPGSRHQDKGAAAAGEGVRQGPDRRPVVVGVRGTGVRWQGPAAPARNDVHRRGACSARLEKACRAQPAAVAVTAPRCHLALPGLHDLALAGRCDVAIRAVADGPLQVGTTRRPRTRYSVTAGTVKVHVCKVDEVEGGCSAYSRPLAPPSMYSTYACTYHTFTCSGAPTLTASARHSNRTRKREIPLTGGWYARSLHICGSGDQQGVRGYAPHGRLAWYYRGNASCWFLHLWRRW